MRNHILTSDAKEDLRRIYYYGVFKFGINQADRYFNMLHDCFEEIVADPYLYSSAEHFKKGYRSCVCGIDTIYFSIKDDTTVEIITIVGRQDFP